MTAPTPRVGQQRPGGRAARVRADVLQATTDLLTEVGYERMTVEEVAARAGVHKTTVYRRWPSKPELVFDAVGTNSAEAVPVPDAGNLRDDLRAFARSVAANIGTEGGARRSRSVVAAAITAGELGEVMQQFWADRFAAARPIVERAIERGELPADTDPDLIIETLIGPLWVRLLLTGRPVTADLADRAGNLVASGATRPGEPAG